MPTSEPILPEFREWSIAAVRLLQGAIYSDERPEWDVLLASKTTLERFLGHLGLLLVVDEPERLAYLRQAEESEQSAGYERLPRLFRKSRLGYEDTLLCVLLRGELRRFDVQEIQHERCVIATTDLFEQWKAFYGIQSDEVRLRKSLGLALGRLEVMKFVRLIGKDPEEWEVRRILKARLPVARLESLLELMRSVQKDRATFGESESADA